MGLNAFINAQGFAKIGMLTVVIGAICNIILDPIFIFLLNMGVRGAALATIISQGVSCVWILKFLMGNKSTLRLQTRYMRIQPKVVIPCVALGVSPFIMQFTESILNVCFNTSLLKYGGDTAVGAMTILGSVMQFTMLPLQGLSQGAQPIVSFNYGANNIKRVKKAFRLLLLCSLSFSVMSDFKIFGMTLFELFDFFSSNILLPVGGVFFSIFVGWFVDKRFLHDQLTSNG